MPASSIHEFGSTWLLASVCGNWIHRSVYLTPHSASFLTHPSKEYSPNVAQGLAFCRPFVEVAWRRAQPHTMHPFDAHNTASQLLPTRQFRIVSSKHLLLHHAFQYLQIHPRRRYAPRVINERADWKLGHLLSVPRNELSTHGRK